MTSYDILGIIQTLNLGRVTTAKEVYWMSFLALKTSV